jgi:hypothetical protein
VRWHAAVCRGESHVTRCLVVAVYQRVLLHACWLRRSRRGPVVVLCAKKRSLMAQLACFTLWSWRCLGHMCCLCWTPLCPGVCAAPVPHQRRRACSQAKHDREGDDDTVPRWPGCRGRSSGAGWQSELCRPLPWLLCWRTASETLCPPHGRACIRLPGMCHFLSPCLHWQPALDVVALHRVP